MYINEYSKQFSLKKTFFTKRVKKKWMTHTCSGAIQYKAIFSFSLYVIFLEKMKTTGLITREMKVYITIESF